MTTISITADKLNAWMHEHHADTVADLAQRCLVMEFFDAKFRRPTTLRVSSNKAEFGFHLPVPESVQSHADMAPMMASANGEALGFQQAFDAYESVYANKLPARRPLLPVSADMSYSDSAGWHLERRPPGKWRHCGWCIGTITAKLSSAITTWAEIQAEYHAVLKGLNLLTAMKDPQQSRYVTPGFGICFFELHSKGSGLYKYAIVLQAVHSEETNAPEIIAHLVAYGEYVDGFVGVNKGATFYIHPFRKMLIHLGRTLCPMSKKLKPEDLGMSNETVSMLMSMNLPLGAGMARNIATTESYSMDFTMDDQAATSGLSL